MHRILGDIPPERVAKLEASLSRLTRREIDVLRALVSGLTSTEVAREFKVSRRTR
jgi:FixJ family two-component response regulator